MSVQIGDFVQLSDDHARFDMTDGVGTRDGSLRTPHDYGRVSSLDARLKLAEVTSVTRLDAGGSAIKWSYGIRQLKRADQSVGVTAALHDARSTLFVHTLSTLVLLIAYFVEILL
jgi:hypothetical protein